MKWTPQMKVCATLYLDQSQLRDAVIKYVDATFGIKVSPEGVLIMPTGSCNEMQARVDITDHVTLPDHVRPPA